VSNTLTIAEPTVDVLMLTYAGIQLERGPASTGSFSMIAQLPYVADQTTYTYVDASGQSTDWYRSARYTALGALGPYSQSWPVSKPDLPGISLAEIEQATARRIGPYYCLAMDRQVPSTASLQRAYFPGLKSTVELDLVTNLWLLRRGVDFQGNPVDVVEDDRQRTVAIYDPAAGGVTVDRPWSVVPAPGEVCEFHHLNPGQELRPAVQAGLRRCFFGDRYSLGSGYIFEADLTAALPWLTDTKWVWQIQLWSPWTGTPAEIPFVTFIQSGHVCIRLQAGGYPGFSGANFASEVQVLLERPVSSWVNQTESTVGPTLDDDMLEVDLDYAASAGHIEAWHNFPGRMAAAAAGGLQSTQAMAALEFTRQAAVRAPRKPDQWGLESVFGPGYSGVHTVVNA
jgi:hypothetical protein